MYDCKVIAMKRFCIYPLETLPQWMCSRTTEVSRLADQVQLLEASPSEGVGLIDMLVMEWSSILCRVGLTV